MKILYAIQGTGNGHISRAKDIIPHLQNHCETHILISGTQAELNLPFEVHYRFRGLSFIFGKNGGVDLWNTYIEANKNNLRKEIKNLPVENYDFVINDFEPVSAWASYMRKVPCIALSHQSSLLNKNVPKPKNKDILGKFILNNYAPASYKYGFHFCNYSRNIFTPVIRTEIRNADVINRGHYTVYLPSYSDKKIISILSEFKHINWQVFSKHCRSRYYVDDYIEINPVSNISLIKSISSSCGVLCGAGFEMPAETLFLGKKLMVIPMKAQYEQQCNAAALKSMGVPVLKKLKEKYINDIADWLETDFRIEISYPDITAKVISKIFETHVQRVLKDNHWDREYQLTFPEELHEKARKKTNV